MFCVASVFLLLLLKKMCWPLTFGLFSVLLYVFTIELFSWGTLLNAWLIINGCLLSVDCIVSWVHNLFSMFKGSSHKLLKAVYLTDNQVCVFLSPCAGNNKMQISWTVVSHLLLISLNIENSTTLFSNMQGIVWSSALQWLGNFFQFLEHLSWVNLSLL